MFDSFLKCGINCFSGEGIWIVTVVGIRVSLVEVLWMGTIDIVSAYVEVDISLLLSEIVLVDVSVITAKEFVSFDCANWSDVPVVVVVSVCDDFSKALGKTVLVFVLSVDAVLSMVVNVFAWNDVKKEDILFERFTL